MVELENLKSEELQLNPSGPNRSSGIRFWRQDTIALFLAAIMVLCVFAMLVLLGLLLLAVLQSVLGINVPLVGDFVQWLGRGSKGFLLAVGLALAALVSYLLLRSRISKHALLYSDAGCPQCREYDLLRVRRSRPDRAVAFLGIQTRRYACRNCSWVGMRIGRPVAVDGSSQKTLAPELVLLNDLSVQQGETATNDNG